MAHRDDHVGMMLHHQTDLKLMSTRTRWRHLRRKQMQRDLHLVHCSSHRDTRITYEMVNCKALPFHRKPAQSLGLAALKKKFGTWKAKGRSIC